MTREAVYHKIRPPSTIINYRTILILRFGSGERCLYKALIPNNEFPVKRAFAFDAVLFARNAYVPGSPHGLLLSHAVC